MWKYDVLQVYVYICILYVVGTPFECRTMAEYLTNNQYSLFQNLSYQKMRRYLVTYDVLTDEEQSRIDNCSNKISMVIANITNHLYSNQTSKLKGFLQLLEEDGDPDFKKAAIRLG